MVGPTDRSTPDSTSNQYVPNLLIETNNSGILPTPFSLDMSQVEDMAPGNNNDTAVLPRQDPNEAVGYNNEMRTPSTLAMGDEGNLKVSSSYSDLIVDIGSRTVTIKGNARIEAVESCIKALDNKIFTCTICGYMS